MRNIILIGMPGSGKTTFGKAIAERLGRPFIDADDYLEEKEGRTIASLDRDAKDIASDVEVEKRPLLKDGPQKVYDLYQERITLYRNAADTIIGNHGTEEEVLEKILAIIEGL